VISLIIVGLGLLSGLLVLLIVRRLAGRQKPGSRPRSVTLVMPAELPKIQVPVAPASTRGPPVLVTPMVAITHSGGRSAPPAPTPRAPRSRPRPRTLLGIGADLVELARAVPTRERTPEPSPPEPRRAPDPALLDLYPISGGWQPDASLVPSKRKALADQLLARAISRCFVVAIFGTPETAARKARVASELALALSASGEPRTLLLEANLQQPRLHHQFRVSMPPSCGFSQQLRARIRGATALKWGVVACRDNLHALVEGRVLSPGVVLSTHFEACIRELRGCYDLIVIDGPFSSQRADYRAVEAVVDGILRLEDAHSSPGASPQLLSRPEQPAFDW